MSWQTWEIGTTEADQNRLSDMIFALMCEIAYELEDPDLNEWFDAGIQIGDGEGDMESIIVFYEMEETEQTFVDGTMTPGYTLTIQESDGQQETETFFNDGDEEWWREAADSFAKMVVDHYRWSFANQS